MAVKHEAFVYCWVSKDNETYVGYHIGSEKDGYVCSSPEVKKRIESEKGWTRKILAYGTAREMQAFETGWLRGVDARKSDKYLNKWNNDDLFGVGSIAVEHKRDYYEGMLMDAGIRAGVGKNSNKFYVIFIDDLMVSCNPDWVSKKDQTRIERMKGKKVGCTVTWKGDFAYFGPANLNEA